MNVPNECFGSACSYVLCPCLFNLGHVLTTVSEGESTFIPVKVIRYCLNQVENINMETTLNVLVSPSHRVTDIPNAEMSTDPVVRYPS